MVNNLMVRAKPPPPPSKVIGLKDQKLPPVQTFQCMGLMSFSFSNYKEELGFASFFRTPFEDSNDVIPMNRIHLVFFGGKQFMSLFDDLGIFN